MASQEFKQLLESVLLETNTINSAEKELHSKIKKIAAEHIKNGENSSCAFSYNSPNSGKMSIAHFSNEYRGSRVHNHTTHTAHTVNGKTLDEHAHNVADHILKAVKHYSLNISNDKDLSADRLTSFNDNFRNN